MANPKLTFAKSAALVITCCLIQCGLGSTLMDKTTSLLGGKCSDKDACCDEYPGQIRCIRGPCSDEFFIVTFFHMSVPIENVTFLDLLMVLWTTANFWYPGIAMIALIIKQDTSLLIHTFFILFWATFNTILGDIIVAIDPSCSVCQRPNGACADGNGMPSGHAATAIGMFVWIVLEMYNGYLRNLNNKIKFIGILINAFIWIPLPYSRYYLGDHTSLQLWVGSFEGIIFGFINFYAFQMYLGKYLKKIANLNCWQNENCLCKSCLHVNDDYWKNSIIHRKWNKTNVLCCVCYCCNCWNNHCNQNDKDSKAETEFGNNQLLSIKNNNNEKDCPPRYVM